MFIRIDTCLREKISLTFGVAKVADTPEPLGGRVEHDKCILLRFLSIG